MDPSDPPRAEMKLARVRDETRARVSARADCPDDNTALDAARAVALGAFARRSETRWREQIERESERAVEDRRRQRHVDARLTRLEDAVAALTRTRALEEKADAERTAAAAAAAAAAARRAFPFAGNRRWIRGYGNQGDVQSLRIRSEDAERERVRAVATKPRAARSERPFAAAGARAELAVAAPKPPREPQPPMGALP